MGRGTLVDGEDVQFRAEHFRGDIRIGGDSGQVASARVGFGKRPDHVAIGHRLLLEPHRPVGGPGGELSATAFSRNFLSRVSAAAVSSSTTMLRKLMSPDAGRLRRRRSGRLRAALQNGDQRERQQQRGGLRRHKFLANIRVVVCRVAFRTLEQPPYRAGDARPARRPARPPNSLIVSTVRGRGGRRTAGRTGTPNHRRRTLSGRIGHHPFG